MRMEMRGVGVPRKAKKRRRRRRKGRVEVRRWKERR